MKKIFLLIVVLLLVVGCTDDYNTRRTLESAGYTDIQTTGYEMFACGQDDHFRTGFIAKNPKGKIVSGVVCCGLIGKACTIRF